MYLNRGFTVFCISNAEMPGYLNANSEVLEHCLYDHRPLCLNQDDYERVCEIPKRKVEPCALDK